MKAFQLIGAIVLWFLTASPALAGGNEYSGEPFEPIDAQAIIDDCWSKSEELRSLGTIAEYGYGLNITHSCMEEAVLEQINSWLLPEFTESAEAHLHALRELHGDLYFRIYSKNRYCSRSCGLLTGMRYIEHYLQFLETILRDIAAERNYRER